MGMGRSRSIKYVVRLEFGTNTFNTPAEWRTRARNNVPSHGKPNAANLAKYVHGFEASTQPGGVNAHLGVQKVTSARVIDQETRTVVAEYFAQK